MNHSTDDILRCQLDFARDAIRAVLALIAKEGIGDDENVSGPIVDNLRKALLP